MTTGADLKDWFLLLAGNIFILAVAGWSVAHFTKREWGELIGMVIAAIVVAGFVYFPDQTIAFFQQIWQTFQGTGGAVD